MAIVGFPPATRRLRLPWRYASWNCLYSVNRSILKVRWSALRVNSLSRVCSLEAVGERRTHITASALVSHATPSRAQLNVFEHHYEDRPRSTVSASALKRVTFRTGRAGIRPHANMMPAHFHPQASRSTSPPLAGGRSACGCDPSWRFHAQAFLGGCPETGIESCDARGVIPIGPISTTSRLGLAQDQ